MTKTKGKAGRPTKLTETVQATLCRSIASGETDVSACARAGIYRTTFIDWMNKGREANSGAYFEFFAAVTRARAQALNRAVKAFRSGLVDNVATDTITETFTETRLDKNGQPYEYKCVTQKTVNRAIPADWRAGRDWLERRDKDHWSARQEITGADNAPLQINIVGVPSRDTPPADPDV